MRIGFLKIGSANLVTSKNAIAKTGSETLDLRFDAIRHVDVTTKGNVAVGPQRMLSAWRPSFIKQTLLRNQRKRSLRNFPARHVAFGSSHLMHRASEMNCAGATAGFRFPRDWSAQGIVNFENSGSVPERFQAAPVPRRQSLVGDAQKSPHGNIQKNRARFRQVVP